MVVGGKPQPPQMQILPSSDPIFGNILEVESLARRIADAAVAIFKSAPGQTWVKLTIIPVEHDAEYGIGPPDGVFPVLVRVLKRRVERGEPLQGEVKTLTADVARACGHPIENAHLVYSPDTEGRVAVGGRIVGE